jgi:hypothetical protein
LDGKLKSKTVLKISFLNLSIAFLLILSYNDVYALRTATCPGCEINNYARPKPSPPGPTMRQEIEAIRLRETVINNQILFNLKLKKLKLDPLPLSTTNKRHFP